MHGLNPALLLSWRSADTDDITWYLEVNTTYQWDFGRYLMSSSRICMTPKSRKAEATWAWKYSLFLSYNLAIWTLAKIKCIFNLKSRRTEFLLTVSFPNYLDTFLLMLFVARSAKENKKRRTTGLVIMVFYGWSFRSETVNSSLRQEDSTKRGSLSITFSFTISDSFGKFFWSRLDSLRHWEPLIVISSTLW